MQRVALALLLVLGGCLVGFAQNSKPFPITKEALELRLAALERDREQAIANVNAYDGAIQECQFWIELLKDAEQEEAMIEFPKWKYHKEKKAVVVNSAEEEEALGKGWADSPAAFQAKAEDIRGGPGLAGTEVLERQVAAELLSKDKPKDKKKPK